jgi:predicted transcriptional regulator of viral defense system
MPRSSDTSTQRAEELFRAHHGLLRTSEALRAGIHPRVLYALRDAGVIAAVSRGLYRLADLPPLGNPDLATVARRVPQGVVCLLSALSYHGITTQVPHAVYVALPRGAEPPRLDYPPLKVVWFSAAAFTYGVEVHDIDDVHMRIYSAPKTVADSFKYRNRLGLPVAIEALKLYRETDGFDLAEALACARVCRVENVIRPYLEALL